MRGWHIGLALSLAIHVMLFVAAKNAPEPSPRLEPEAEPIFLTMRDVPAPKVEAETNVVPAPTTLETDRRERRRERRRRRAKERARSSGAEGATPGLATGDASSGPVTDGAGSVLVEGGTGGGGVVTAGPPGQEIDLAVRPRAPIAADAPILPGPPPPPTPGPRLKESGGGTLTYEHRSFTAKIDHDGTVEFDDHIAGVTPMGAWFDVTDTLMAVAGDDAYSSAKLRLLDETRDQRLAMKARACEERLDRSLVTLRADLDTVWADRKLSVDAKKRTLFTLWDDCAEEGSESVVEHGRMARATIIAFVRRQIDAGTVHAYTDTELVALNARRHSKARFNPYGTTDDDR